MGTQIKGSNIAPGSIDDTKLSEGGNIARRNVNFFLQNYGSGAQGDLVYSGSVNLLDMFIDCDSFTLEAAAQVRVKERILVVRATNHITVNAGAVLAANGSYANYVLSNKIPGESITGSGGGGGAAGSFIGAYGTYAGNDGFDGQTNLVQPAVTTASQGGISISGQVGPSGIAGLDLSVQSDKDIITHFLPNNIVGGNAGGDGGAGGYYGANPAGAGGLGGGVIILVAPIINIIGGVYSIGQNGGHGNQVTGGVNANGSGGGGGGGGGTIIFATENLVDPNPTTIVTGGTAGLAGVGGSQAGAKDGGAGGAGGDGYVEIISL